MKSTSVVIPAYNEEKRIEKFLNELLYFKEKNNFIKEVIVVNDGSTDSTYKILKKYKNKIRVLNHNVNKGKGAAVKTGVLAATGSNIIFMDADGSTSPSQIPKLLKALKKSQIAIGSRIDRNSKIIRKQPLIRIILGKIFNLSANVLFPSLRIFDTLCGFKGMRSREGKKIFSKLIMERWIFDVEMLMWARKMGYKIAIVPIEWKHEGNTKMNLGINNIKMFLELLKLRVMM